MSVRLNPQGWTGDFATVPDSLSALYSTLILGQSLLAAVDAVSHALGFERFRFGMTTAQTLDKLGIESVRSDFTFRIS